MIIHEKFHLASRTTIRLGGVCEAYFPENITEFLSLVVKFEEEGIEYQVLGRMSNVLPPDGFANTKVIFPDKISEVNYRKGSISLSSGIRFSRIIYALHKDKKLLCPRLIGIPGSVGGMVFQNASCFDEEICSALMSAEVFSIKERKVIHLNREEMAFSYRSSILKNRDLILLNAVFSVSDGDASETIQMVTQRRKKTMPEGPSLGSVFLKNDGLSIGYLLDSLGQKGRRFGGISVSTRHAGVLINDNYGSSSDYKLAVQTLKNLIQEYYGFQPQCEIEYLR